MSWLWYGHQCIADPLWYSGQYLRLSRGRPGFNSRRRKLLQLDITRPMSMQISSVRISQKLILSYQAEIAQLVARRSHNPKVVSSILTFRMAWRCLVSYALARAVDHCRLGPGPSAFQTDTSRLSRHGHEFLGGLGYPSTAEINKSDHTRSRTWVVAATSRRPGH